MRSVFGGFLFNAKGKRSNQLDILVLSDVIPQFNVLGKSFSPVDGTAAIIEIKSNLQTIKLLEALESFRTVLSKVGPKVEDQEGAYDDWPFKVVYAHKGMQANMALKKLNGYYSKNKNIPASNRPNIIHVCSEYVIYRDAGNLEYQVITERPDVFGLAWSFLQIQHVAIAQRTITIDFMEYLKPLFSAAIITSLDQSLELPKEEI